MQVWQSRENFFTADQSNTSVLQWFPQGVSLPDRKLLFHMADILDDGSVAREMRNDVIHYYKVAVVMLDLYEEVY